MLTGLQRFLVEVAKVLQMPYVIDIPPCKLVDRMKIDSYTITPNNTKQRPASSSTNSRTLSHV